MRCTSAVTSWHVESSRPGCGRREVFAATALAQVHSGGVTYRRRVSDDHATFARRLAYATEQTILQRVVPYERQGRVFGFAQSVEMAASPLTAFLMGPLTQLFFIPASGLDTVS